MAEKREVKAWITVRGKHIPIFEGESKSDAIVRVMDEDMERNPEMKKANDAVVEHSNKVAEKERNKREYELKKKDKEITDRAAREKLRNQISKDNDEKEKQIKQNEEEKRKVQHGFSVSKEGTRVAVRRTMNKEDRQQKARINALGDLKKYAQTDIQSIPQNTLLKMSERLKKAGVDHTDYDREYVSRVTAHQGEIGARKDIKSAIKSNNSAYEMKKKGYKSIGGGKYEKVWSEHVLDGLYYYKTTVDMDEKTVAYKRKPTVTVQRVEKK